jgi:ribosomal protein S18 acetylase RimI-like enzyme
MKFKLKTFTKNIDEIHGLIKRKLVEYNTSQIGSNSRPPEKIAFAYYNNEQLIAGLYAYQSLGNFYIDLLWVDENYRHQKLGTKLLNIAKEYAEKNKALYVRVDTASFQAPEFYLKNGYECFAKLPIAVEGKEHQYNYYFVKYLN